MAAALEFAHARGVIHRDVKPGNVLIDRSGQVKVADFGIARAAGVREGLTQTGAVMGTATYFSPEQAQGVPVDARSDVYSLGVVLYEMVVGKAPFDGDNPVAIAYKHVREDPVAPTVANQAVPAPLEQIILKAMAKDPGARYQSAGELRADLLRYLQGAAVLASPPALVADVAPTRVQDRYTEAVGPGLLEPPGKRRTGLYVALLAVMLAVLAGLLFLLGRQLGWFGSTKHVTIPADVIGKDQSTAQGELQGLGLKVQSQSQSNNAQPGTVVNTDPKPGTSVRSGSTVTMVVSSGPPQVQVPDVRNQDVNTATQTLRNAGFTVQTAPQNSDTVPANVVIDQSPAANGHAAKGSTVTLTVSAGKVQVTIPDESGKDPTTAANDLGNLGLKIQVQFEASDTIPQGAVTRTDPPAGTAVPKGSTVIIYESTGPTQVSVANIVGQSLPQATATLEQAGFKVSSSTGATTNPAQDGQVISQSPTGGTRLAKGSTVTVVVGKFTPPSTTTTTPPSTTTTSPSATPTTT